MTSEMFATIAEEIGEVETLAELEALRRFGAEEHNAYEEPECAPLFQAATERLTPVTSEPAVKEAADMSDLKAYEAKIAELVAQLAELKATPAVRPQVVRGTRRYRLLSFDVKWSTTPQVHAIAAILAANAKVGDVLDEADIVKMMVANEHVLETRQGGKRIWNYYKGRSDRGLMTHGNIELA
jgi:hypothetical protein